MDIFDLFAKLSLDSSEYDKGLDESSEKAQGFGGRLTSVLGGAIKTAAGFGAAAIGAATTAVSAISGMAVSGYAEYEQLVGGVKKLYANEMGDASDLLIEYANQAYATAGVSANEYMSTATSFSAAMVNSLGGDVTKAAEMTDVAMRAISDNVNTFGSDAESVSNAIMGLSRNNYTMLDNLKLGYAGTADGMLKLVNDSGVLKDRVLTDTKELNELGFATMIEAIQAVQEQQGIAGTTAHEAMTTIEGSATATKAAWQNVVTAIARGEGLEKAFDGLITSIFGEKDGEGLLNQIIPRFKTAIQGLGDFIVTASPYISEKLPEVVDAVLPAALDAGIALVGSVMEVIPDVILSASSTILDAVVGLVGMASEAVLGYDMTESVASFGNGIVDLLGDKVPDFISQGIDFVLGLLSGMERVDVFKTIAHINEGILIGLLRGLPKILNTGMNFIMTLGDGMLDNLPNLIGSVGDIVNTVLNFLLSNMPEFLEKGVEVVSNLASGVIRNLPAIASSLGRVVAQILATITSNLPQILAKGIELIGRLAAGIIRGIPQAVATIPQLFSQFVSGFANYDWASLGGQIIDGIKSGILGAAGRIADAARSIGGTILGAAKSFFQIASPSKLMRDEIGKNIALGIGVGFEENIPEDDMLAAQQNAFDKIRDQQEAFDYDWEIGYNVNRINGEGGNGRGTANITINVYPSEGMDERELADMVSERFRDEYNERRAVYA